MKKYEEEHYRYDAIKDKIYPWVKNELVDQQALNGKNFSEKDTMVLEFIGNLKVIFVIKRGEDSYEILKDAMLPPHVSAEEVYHKACENLVRDVEFVIGNTWYGAFGIIADGVHEASSVCFKHIWQMCAEKLKDDLIIYVPQKDTVLFAPLSQQKVVEQLAEHAKGAYEAGGDKISLTPYLFSKERKELMTYEV